MITFLTVPSSTIFGKQHVLVVCMILLVRLPSALTRLRGCFPQALLASAVRCGEGLLLPNGPSMAEGGGPQQRGPQRRGPPPPLPGVVRGCRAVPPEVGWGWGGGTPWLLWVPAWIACFRSQGLLLQVLRLGNFHPYPS